MHQRLKLRFINQRFDKLNLIWPHHAGDLDIKFNFSCAVYSSIDIYNSCIAASHLINAMLLLYLAIKVINASLPRLHALDFFY